MNYLEKINKAMVTKKIGILALVVLGWVGIASAHINPEKGKKPNTSDHTPSTQTSIDFRNNCNSAVKQTDQAINNVRARLTTGGDVWWTGDKGSYVVPKVEPGVPEVSSIYAGAVWLGGKDDGDNLKVAAQTYGRNQGNFDFWPGPLEESGADQGTTDDETCKDWDKFFKVTAKEIELFKKEFRIAEDAGEVLEIGKIPLNIRRWPAKGNPYFLEIYGFELPNTDQGLAGFHDEDADTFYDPVKGDFPVIEIRGCEEPLFPPQYGDEMIFWIYNDAGNTHAESEGDKINMEVQVQAFSYSTNDEINNMTFQRYKLINRAVESIKNTYFAMWTDPDLGCHSDDYIGCDIGRSMAYVYNEDATDGESGGCSCGDVNTYCDEVPILGVDYFRGPLDENEVELGMSSFTYYNNGSPEFEADNGTTDPDNAQEYYNYMSGFWKDGTPFQQGGDAHQQGTESVAYAFTDAPNDDGGWSMCSEDLPFGDRRTVQASGPFRLDPGAVNELIVGVVWVPNQSYPCPSISKLQEADDIAQKLFDECFKIPNGPDAPDVDYIELDQEIIAIFTNGKDIEGHNNFEEKFQETGLRIPSGEPDSLYFFEGYQLYQLSGPDVGLTPANREDADKVRLVYQVDIKNGISKIFNWKSLLEDDKPFGEDFSVPVEQVDGGNLGVRHTFKITEDQFADGDRKLINHKKYYFVAIAYAYNNYEEFDAATQLGQKEPYLEGRRNIGPNADGKPYTVIPRPITDRIVNAEFEDGAIITRRDGVGTGTNFLDLTNETRAEIEAGFASGTPVDVLTYRAGRGPIDVLVYNPLDVKDGEYLLNFIDEDLSNAMLDTTVTWTIENLDKPGEDPFVSERTIDTLNEQIVPDLGYSITIGQVADAGTEPAIDPTNGAIGAEVEYVKGANAEAWLSGVPDGFRPGEFGLDLDIFNYVPTGIGESFNEFDPNQALTKMGNGFFVPYWLCNWVPNEDLTAPYITPAWTNNSNNNGIVHGPLKSKLSDVNNVDIVFTSNKDLWSRCVVIESTGTSLAALGIPTAGNRKHFDLRAASNVTKDADADGKPVVDTNDTGEGMGWFPGYAIDVETGQRLNIFFGESSVYDGAAFPEAYTETPSGADMMFNPGSQLKLNLNGAQNVFQYVTGGQHFVYVTDQPYDECTSLRSKLKPSPADVQKVNVIKDITWAGLITSLPGSEMLSYADGLIPDDVIVKLRVNSPYSVLSGTDEYNGYPAYGFAFNGKVASELDEAAIDEALMKIAVVPNPYYGFSKYEGSQFETIVKITNLPAKCVVNIYSLDGRFIRRYDRDEIGTNAVGLAIDRNQVIPDIEWDLKNGKGIPIASGVYLIHIEAEGLGERTIKWFGVNRQFDPTGL